MLHSLQEYAPGGAENREGVLLVSSCHTPQCICDSKASHQPWALSPLSREECFMTWCTQDPACVSLCHALLYFKGFHAIQVGRGASVGHVHMRMQLHMPYMSRP